MLRRFKEAAEQGEPHRLGGTRSGTRRRGCLRCVWEEPAAFIWSRRQRSERKAIEFISLLQNKDHKETNNKSRQDVGGGVGGEVQLALWEIQAASSLFPEGPVCLRLTVLGTLNRKHHGDRNQVFYSLSPGGMLAFHRLDVREQVSTSLSCGLNFMSCPYCLLVVG